MEERETYSETRVFKAIFPNDTNHYNTLFGGAALALMDEVAFITATRHTRKKMVTVSTEKIDFKMPIPGGTIIEVVGRVARVGNKSLTVKVEIFVEEMYADERKKAIEGLITLVAIDDASYPLTTAKLL